MLGVAAYVVTPGSFAMLVYGSFAAVVAANLVYTGWARQAQGSLDAALEAAA